MACVILVIAKDCKKMNETAIGTAGKWKRCTEKITGKRAQMEYSEIMQKYVDRITIDPEQCGGKPCIRGMRIRVRDVLSMLADGMSEEDIIDYFEDLEHEDLLACYEFAASQSDHSILKAS